MHWQTRYPKIKLQLCGLQILYCHSILIPKQSNTNFGIYQLGNHNKNCLLPRIRLNNHGHLHKGTKYNIIPRKTKQRRTLHLYHSMVLNTRMHVRALFYSYTLIIKEKKRKKCVPLLLGRQDLCIKCLTNRTAEILLCTMILSLFSVSSWFFPCLTEQTMQWVQWIIFNKVFCHQSLNNYTFSDITLHTVPSK